MLAHRRKARQTSEVPNHRERFPASLVVVDERVTSRMVVRV